MRDRVPPPPKPAPVGGRRVVVVDRPDLGQAQITIAHEGIARTFPERIAASKTGNAARPRTRARREECIQFGRQWFRLEWVKTGDLIQR